MESHVESIFNVKTPFPVYSCYKMNFIVISDEYSSEVLLAFCFRLVIKKNNERVIERKIRIIDLEIR
jgi:hypothetical protein